MTIDVLFPVEFVQAIVGLLILVALDLVLGVSVAIKQKKFEWSKLADFYSTSIIPNVLGWAVADVLLRVAAFYHLPIVDAIQPLATGGLYALALIAILAQLGSKLAVLRGEVTPV